MMMKNWKGLVELLGIVAIVASLTFVGVELQQSRSIAIGDGNMANAEIQIERNNAINEYINIWTRGNLGETLSQEEEIIFDNLVENSSVHSFMEYARLRQLDFTDAQEAHTAEYAIFLYNNPEARKVWGVKEKFRSNYFTSPPARAECSGIVYLAT